MSLTSTVTREESALHAVANGHGRAINNSRSVELADLVVRANGLSEVLRAEAPISDETRQLTPRTVSALTEARMFRLFSPVRWGGYEAPAGTSLEVCMALARGCCSASWVTSVLCMGNYIVAQLPREAQAEVWDSKPDARTALIIVAPKANVERTEDGVIVSGEWGYASGCLHADWIGALIACGPTPQDDTTHFILMRREEVTIRDSWRMAGMRGTGSNTVVAEKVFVPRHRLMPYASIVTGKVREAAGADNLYRSSFSGMLSVGLLGAQIGAAEAAFDHVRKQAPQRRVASSTFKSQSQSPAFQTDLAEAAMLIEGARLHARKIARTVEEHARADILPDEVTRSSFRMGAAHVTRACREAVEKLVTAYGSSAFQDTDPLQRLWRDVHVASRHAGFGMGIPQLVHGRALLGLDPREVSYLV